MSEENMESEIETNAVENQVAKTFTQDELDRIVADRISREQRKFDKKLSGIDLNEARDLLAEKQAADIERQKERGEFDSILKQTVEKKDMEIQSYKSKLQQTLVDGAILGAASNNNAVNPTQVSQLLKDQTRLSEDGTVEVLDANKVPRYNDSSELLSVNEMVVEFLTVNHTWSKPHKAVLARWVTLVALHRSLNLWQIWLQTGMMVVKKHLPHLRKSNH